MDEELKWAAAVVLIVAIVCVATVWIVDTKENGRTERTSLCMGKGPELTNAKIECLKLVK